MPVRYYDYIAHNARRYAGKFALRDLDTGRDVTYATLNARVSRLAHRLSDTGISKGDRIAILAQNSIEFLELLFACGRLGAILVPLNWRLTAPEIAVIIADSEPRLLFHDQQFAAAAGAVRDLVPSVEACRVLGAEDLDTGALLDATEPLELGDTQIIMYTSGTTGRPKGALLTYAMSFWNSVNLGLPGMITPASVNLSVMPMFHTAGLNVYAIPTLYAGGTVLLRRVFDPGEVLDDFANPAFGITHFFHVPSAWQFLAQHEKFAAADFSHLVLAGVGGAPVPLPLLETWAARGVLLQNGLGMTETGPSMTTLAPEDAIRKVGSVGTPLMHVELKVAREDGSEADDNEPGEIWIRGPAVTPGYWRNPQGNADAFADGWLRGGDIAYRDEEGFLYLLDRAKDMYISGGENVYPAEVESILLQIEEIAAAAVIGVADAKWGETGLAIVTARAGATVTRERVLQHCEGRLARFKHPKDVIIVDALPLTPSGKTHKTTLREMFGNAVPPG